VAEARAVQAGGVAGDVVVMAPLPVAGRPSWMCLCSAQQAADRRELWRVEDRLVVVAVIVTPGVQGQQWGSDALDALRPDQTRLVVPGWRRPDEVAGRLAAMSPVHAIELVGPVDAVAIIDHLDLTVPVASIEGVEATSQCWASLFVEAGSTDRAVTASAPGGARLGDDPILAAVLVAAAEELR